ncbi:GrpE-domain-containing protein [Amylostereum chailletii]|nr:GrpE-domain-containing protein [Amylostereum chailletii]
MSCSHAARVFRTASASMSSRTLVRPSLALSRRRAAFGSTRQYSDASTDKPASDADPKSEAKAEGEKPSECEAKLKAKEEEVVDITGRLRYLQADFLNLQRNAAREKEQTRDFAITRFAGDLLETVDVLALALKSVPESALAPPPSQPSSPENSSPSTSETKSPSAQLKELHHGVEMTHRLLLQTLFKYHVKPFDPTGDKFDPNRHEALYQAPVPGKEPGTVIDCQKIGYTIKDRILRAAQVGVAQETS